MFSKLEAEQVGFLSFSDMFLFTDNSKHRHKRNLAISGFLTYNLFVILYPDGAREAC